MMMMMEAILLIPLLVTNVQPFSNHPHISTHPSIVSPSLIRVEWSSRQKFLPPNDACTNLTSCHARPKSKWDDLIDEDDDDYDDDGTDISAQKSITSDVPPDMVYNEANIRRQADTYDQLESIGGNDVVNDVYVRAPGAKEWWLVGKVARISDVSPEQAIERQWPLIERHVWALRIPVRPTADLSAPFEVWYAPGNSEYDAARNDPKVRFIKVSSLVLSYDVADVQASFVGFVGKAYDERIGEPMFFVERNVKDGSCLRGVEIEGDWVLRSELDDDA